MRPHRPAHVEGAGEIHGDHPIPAVIFLIGEVAPVSAAGVVEKHVYPTILVNYPLDSSVHLLAVGNVATYEQRVSTLVSNRLLDSVSLLLAAGEQSDLCAFLGEQVGSTFADSAVSSGYYRYLAGKSVRHLDLLSSELIVFRFC